MPVGSAFPAALLLAAASLLPVQEIADVLARRQLDPLPPQRLQGLSADALQAVLRQHDPYAAYLAPGEYRRFLAADTDQVGIGVHLFPRDDAWLLQPIPDGPAWRAGLRSDARLYSVDGEGVNGHDADWLARRLHGAPGSRVLLVVQAGDDPRLALEVERQAFRSPSLSLQGHGGRRFIRLWDFRRRETERALRDVLQRLGPVSGPPVIDLRRSGGGDLFEALDSASLFLPEGLSLAAIEDYRGQRREYRSVAGRVADVGPDRPLVLLVGPGTASAAEAFALALRHHGVAVLVGAPTYGKCRTQTLAPLSNGGAIRFSNGRLWGPDGVPCDPRGMRPDLPLADVESRPAAELAAAGLDYLRTLKRSRPRDY